MARLAIGVDLGGTNARAAVVDADSGEIVAAHKEPLRDRAPARVVEVVRHALLQAADAAGVTPAAAGLVGVGVAGQCLGATGVVINAPNLGWRDVAFGSLLSTALGVRVKVANDLAVASWGSQRSAVAVTTASIWHSGRASPQPASRRSARTICTRSSSAKVADAMVSSTGSTSTAIECARGNRSSSRQVIVPGPHARSMTVGAVPAMASTTSSSMLI
jgi:sugar (pentulose or hexulose) kinase